MPELFSASWMQDYAKAWNEDEALTHALAKAGFSARLAYGFEDSAAPLGMLEVRDGRVTRAGAYDGQPADVDLRATPANWMKWLQRPMDPLDLGVALASRQIHSARGDLTALTGEPGTARAFARSVAVMACVARACATATTLPETAADAVGGQP